MLVWLLFPVTELQVPEIDRSAASEDRAACSSWQRRYVVQCGWQVHLSNQATYSYIFFIFVVLYLAIPGKHDPSIWCTLNWLPCNFSRAWNLTFARNLCHAFTLNMNDRTIRHYCVPRPRQSFSTIYIYCFCLQTVSETNYSQPNESDRLNERTSSLPFV